MEEIVNKNNEIVLFNILLFQYVLSSFRSQNLGAVYHQNTRTMCSGLHLANNQEAR